MGKNLWKIFQVYKDQFIAVIPPSNDKWKIEWHKNYEGYYYSSYYDDRYKDTVSILAFKSFTSGEEAAKYIKEIEERNDSFVKDVTRDYLN